MVSSDPQTENSLFLLSFRQRGEVSAIAAAAGWRSVAARTRHAGGEEVRLDVALRALPQDDRSAAAAAVRRVGGGGATAFAHDRPGVGRLVHHVQATAGDPWVHGLIEELGTAPDAAAETDD